MCVTKRPFTYPEVGATAHAHPVGYHSFTRSRVLARTDLHAATAVAGMARSGWIGFTRRVDGERSA